MYESDIQCMYNVTMCGGVFHLMLTIDISLLWLFKQNPLNMHNTASPSRNKVDTTRLERKVHVCFTNIHRMCFHQDDQQHRVVRHTMTLTKGGFCVSPYKHGSRDLTNLRQTANARGRASCSSGPHTSSGTYIASNLTHGILKASHTGVGLGPRLFNIKFCST